MKKIQRFRTIWNNRNVIVKKDEDDKRYFYYEDNPSLELWCYIKMWTDMFFIPAE